MTRTATCACGQLRVTVEREPERVLACNCRECQRRTGSVFGVSAYFAAAAVGIEGTSGSFKRTAGEFRFETGFCP
ncbi:MAG: GFA family protein, partial [Microvirga sp.]